MPRAGEVKAAKELGRKGSDRYTWHICMTCGRGRWVTLPNLKDGHNLTCRVCSSRNSLLHVKHPGIYPRKPLAERFWAKVQKTETCWIWQGAIFKKTGYGQANKNGKPITAHRLAYELTYGITLPRGHALEPDHICRNRLCVNPSHIQVVTHRENTLRGIGITAQHATATHCPQGHPYDFFNTYRRPDGGRDCRLCRARRSRESKARQEVET